MKRMQSFLVISLGLLGLASTATAQDLRLYGGLRFGVAGEAEFEADNGASADEDLLTTFGGQVGLDYLLMEHLALGGELRLAGVNTEPRDDLDVGRDLIIDIVLKPRVRFALSEAFEIYGTLPFGLTLISTNDDLSSSVVDTSQGPGFNLGVGGGVTYLFTDRVGINFEMAYLMYWYGQTTEATVLGRTGKREIDVSWGQFTLFANLVFAL